MSLLSTASPWTSNEECNKKRVSTMRKTVKIRPHSQETDQNIESFESLQNDNEVRNDRVNYILNEMTNVSPDNDGQGLVDFKPPPMPEINLKKDLPSESRLADEPIDQLNNSLQIPIPMIHKVSNPYSSNSHHLSNYQTVYEHGMPNYRTNQVSNMSNESSSKLMDKINYMIHLLEGQENEKTTNVTEEFILYTFLGVFMIYVVDSFSRGGRYVR